MREIRKLRRSRGFEKPKVAAKWPTAHPISHPIQFPSHRLNDKRHGSRWTECPLTFSSSLRLAGETSECLRISGLRGGASPLPSAPIWLPVGPSRASLCLLCSASRIGTSSSESVDSCVTIGWSLEAIFRRQTLHRQEDCNIPGSGIIHSRMSIFIVAICTEIGK